MTPFNDMRRNKNTEAHDKNSEHLTGIVARTFHHYFFWFLVFFYVEFVFQQQLLQLAVPKFTRTWRNIPPCLLYHSVDAKQNNNRLKLNSQSRWKSQSELDNYHLHTEWGRQVTFPIDTIQLVTRLESCKGILNVPLRFARRARLHWRRTWP